MLVDERVTKTPGDQPAVHRQRHDDGDDQG
jgi:hypothetical protein